MCIPFTFAAKAGIVVADVKVVWELLSCWADAKPVWEMLWLSCLSEFEKWSQKFCWSRVCVTVCFTDSGLQKQGIIRYAREKTSTGNQDYSGGFVCEKCEGFVSQSRGPLVHASRRFLINTCTSSCISWMISETHGTTNSCNMSSNKECIEQCVSLGVAGLLCVHHS